MVEKMQEEQRKAEAKAREFKMQVARQEEKKRNEAARAKLAKVTLRLRQ